MTAKPPQPQGQALDECSAREGQIKTGPPQPSPLPSLLSFLSPLHTHTRTCVQSTYLCTPHPVSPTPSLALSLSLGAVHILPSRKTDTSCFRVLRFGVKGMGWGARSTTLTCVWGGRVGRRPGAGEPRLPADRPSGARDLGGGGRHGQEVGGQHRVVQGPSALCAPEPFQAGGRRTLRRMYVTGPRGLIGVVEVPILM